MPDDKILKCSGELKATCISEQNNICEEDVLQHIGVKRRSGRYEWGSGENPYQRTGDFLSRIDALKKSGWKETPENIMNEFGLSTTEYRTHKSLARSDRRALERDHILSLVSDNYTPTQIGRMLGKNESSIRSMLNEEAAKKMKEARATADLIRERIESTGKMIDVGLDVELELNISKEKLNQAIAILEMEGYHRLGGRVPQATNPGKLTTLKVIAPKDTPYKINDKGEKVSAEVYKYDQIESLKEYISRDGGETFEKKFTYPESMDSKRMMIRYAEDGGVDNDGLVEIRRGVKDLSLGESMYSQVRILVDNDHYIKGMAVYADDKDLPEGVDVIFNTNKSSKLPMKDVLKKISTTDPDNPFGSTIKDAEQGGQYWYDDKTGLKWDPKNPVGEKKLGLINKRADEGDWSEWKDALPSQFLSKQSKVLAKRQLGLAIEDKVAEYNDIMALENPTIKKHLLGKFADSCDAAAVDLQAASLPGQKYHVIVPVNTLKDDEVYAPGYESGTKLALVRYPHAGPFEIPIVTVNNNKRSDGYKRIGPQSMDAICVNKKVAERLSGADFDGDTVMCIPTHDPKGKVKITSQPQLIKGFDVHDYDPDSFYKDENGDVYCTRNGHEYKAMGKKTKQIEMGRASNLITDMQLQGASLPEIERATKYSMVVIDAEKHHLDYKQSEKDNNISALRTEYQSHIGSDGKIHESAATLISRSKGQIDVPKRQGTPAPNIKGVKVRGQEVYDPTRPEGALLYRTADDAEYTVNKVNKRTGEVTAVTRTRMEKSTQMAETDDARTLMSKARTPMEETYADYANTMKSMANQARVEQYNAGKIAYDKNAKKIYEKEVKSLNAKVGNAQVNTPKERIAQVYTAAEVERKRAKYKEDTGKDMYPSEVKKIRQQTITKNRAAVQTTSRKNRNINITDKEWEAIQAGAISETQLEKVLKNTDIDEVRERSTPKTRTTLTPAKEARIQAMSASDLTVAQIANKLNLSTSTVSKYLKGGN